MLSDYLRRQSTFQGCVGWFNYSCVGYRDLNVVITALTAVESKEERTDTCIVLVMFMLHITFSL